MQSDKRDSITSELQLLTNTNIDDAEYLLSLLLKTKVDDKPKVKKMKTFNDYLNDWFRER